MDIRNTIGKIPKWVRQYRYPIAIVLVGLILLWIPNLKTETQEQSETVQQEQTQQQEDLATLLADILGQIEGVGKVQVILTLAAGETVIYHSDRDTDTSDSGTSVRTETVIITDADRNETALISQVIPATYQGAVVVCQGADSASVKWAVVEAVSKATGLGANQISVLKMK